MIKLTVSEQNNDMANINLSRRLPTEIRPERDYLCYQCGVWRPDIPAFATTTAAIEHVVACHPSRIAKLIIDICDHGPLSWALCQALSDCRPLADL